MRRLVFLVTLATVVLVAASPRAARAEFPARPIELVVPWAAGGRADLVMRLFARSAARHLPHPVVVVNKPGGSGATGTVAVMNAPADGHTLLAATVGANVIRPLTASLPYRHDSFAPVGQITASTLILASKADRPWKSLAELVADAKRRPSPPTYACPVGVIPHIAMVAVARRAGVELRLVPHQGDGPSATAVLGGHVDMMIGAPPTMLPHLRTGDMRALATFGEVRDPALPDVPTAREQGFDVVATPWTGIAAPKATPPAVLARLQQVFEAALKDPEFVAGMEKLGERITPVVGEAFAARWQQDHDRWEEPARIVRK
jgi:tripartite-type tricarboxylate transporter receptor subunit TctC